MNFDIAFSNSCIQDEIILLVLRLRLLVINIYIQIPLGNASNIQGYSRGSCVRY